MTDKIDAIKIKEEVKDGKAYLLDVRSEEEYAQFSIPDSLNLSVEDIEYGKAPEIPRDSKVYVYCMSGSRAEKAVSLLKMMGFDQAVNVGGIMNLI